MRLINVKTLRLAEFFNRPPPPYAILSHTWGPDEVSFSELAKTRFMPVFGRRFQKVIATCRQAREDGLDFAWIDTCCIDKSSSAELSEAINSMFAWYQRAEVCYAQLEDVVTNATNTTAVNQSGGMSSAFSQSRWFRRGWTLQELVAPRELVFYNAHWRRIGRRDTLADDLAQITSIDQSVLRDGNTVRQVSLGRRMSWAAHRETTRPEDIAYSLLGIFGVQMPLLYGEGAVAAFSRLQEYIFRRESHDHTLIAWRCEELPGKRKSPPPLRGLFASCPSEFSHFQRHIPSTLNFGITTNSTCSEGSANTARLLRVEDGNRITRGGFAIAQDSHPPATQISAASHDLTITGPTFPVTRSLYGESKVLLLNCILSTAGNTGNGSEAIMLPAPGRHLQSPRIGIYVELLRDQYARARPWDLVSLDPTGNETTSEFTIITNSIAKSADDVSLALRLRRTYMVPFRTTGDLVQWVERGDTARFQYGVLLPQLTRLGKRPGQLYVSKVELVEGGSGASTSYDSIELQPGEGQEDKKMLLLCGPGPYIGAHQRITLHVRSADTDKEIVRWDINFSVKLLQGGDRGIGPSRSWSPNDSFVTISHEGDTTVRKRLVRLSLAEVEQLGGQYIPYETWTDHPPGLVTTDANAIKKLRLCVRFRGIGHLRFWEATFQ